MTDPVLLVGRVIEVTGSRVVGELEASVENLYRVYRSRRYAVGQVGSIVKVEAGDHLVFGIVTSLRMVEEQEGPGHSVRGDVKWITLDLLGEGVRTGLGEAEFDFRRGVHTYPLPGHQIFIATAAELRQIYAPPETAGFRAGVLSQAGSIPIYLQTDELLTKHFAVLGTTGAGKSCAISLLVHSMVKSCENAHVVVLDPHDEYSAAFKDLCEPFDPTELELPHWLLNLEEAQGLFIGKTEHVATSQANILKKAIYEARRHFADENGYDDIITVDTPVPYKISDLERFIEEDKPNQASKHEPYDKILAKIDVLKKDKRFAFLIREDAKIEDNMADILVHRRVQKIHLRVTGPDAATRRGLDCRLARGHDGVNQAIASVH